MALQPWEITTALAEARPQELGALFRRIGREAVQSRQNTRDIQREIHLDQQYHRTIEKERQTLKRQRVDAFALHSRPGLDLFPPSVKKFVDVSDSLLVTAVGPVGAIQTNNLTPVAAASGAQGRNNMCIAIHSLQIRAVIFDEQTVSGAITLAQMLTAAREYTTRVTILVDKQPNKAAISAAEIWSGSNILTPLNLDNRKRVKIIRDHTSVIRKKVAFTRNNAADTYSAAISKIHNHFEWYIPFKTPIKVEFDPDSTLGGIAQITDNAFSIWLMTGHYDVTYAAAKMDYTCRIRYTDCT